MSCAEVCIDHAYDYENDFYSEKIVTARKPHKCCECRRVITVSARYELASGKCDGRIFSATTCLLCSEIRDAFVCGSFQFGKLWESIDDNIFPIWETSGPIDCLAKIETLEARNILREKYQEWLAEVTRRG